MGFTWAGWGVLAAGVLMRLLVGLWPHSGMGQPPKYGDFEAHRHWMEVTLNLPRQDWYRAGPDNDLEYWGLDYPPLAALQSWVTGAALARAEPEAFLLHESRGFEEAHFKLLMRWTALAWDTALHVLPLAALVVHLSGGSPSEPRVAWAMAVALLSPAQVLIDHGHFQPNHVSLGLSAAAALMLARGKPRWAVALYVLAVNHKQMALYYAPAFTAHLLGRAVRFGVLSAIAAVVDLGLVAAATMALVWAPVLRWTSIPDALADARLVLERVFPIHRGLYEDYVASFWCATNPIFRWRTWAPSSAVILALLATLLALLPAFLREVRRPSPQGLVAAMAASSWAFFLFSYHAHEKSVLFPLLPTLLLSALPLSGPPDATSPALALAPRLVPLVVAASVASMAPLLSRDALLLPSAAALAAFLATVAAWGSLDERPSAADWASAAGATGFEPAKTRGAIMAAMVPARPWDAVRGAPAPAPAGVEAAPRPPPAVKEGCCARSREVDGGAGGLERQRSGGCFPGCLLPSTRRRLQRRSSGMSPSNHPLPWPAVEERGTDVGDEGGEEAGALSSQATRGEREEGPGAWLRSADRASALAMRFAPDWALRAVSGLVGWDMVAVGSGEGASAQWKGPGWAGAPPGVAFLALVTMCGALAVLGVGLAAMVLQPPDRFPYLFDYLAVASSFAVFAGVTVWVNAAHAELAGE